MSAKPGQKGRVVSGMRPTGQLHLGNYHGALVNWIELQARYECFFFVADWHALTTGYEDTATFKSNCREVVIDWLGAGLDPRACTMFVQSRVPEHAELHLILSMVTPVSWLERVPTYKDQMEQLKDKDLSTYGFLGYPLLQSADILMYRPQYVPVGEDQVAHVEITREIARRFNNIYGRETDSVARVESAVQRLGAAGAAQYADLRRQYQQQGNTEALARARALVESGSKLSGEDRERLLGDLAGGGRAILPEPEVLLTRSPKVPGLDGRKMSKSYDNTIRLREDPASVEKKLKAMQTDPARVRRSDPGDPEKCPVFSLHRIYSSAETQAWAAQGCRTAGIGCLECKKPLIDSVLAELAPIRERAREYEANPARVADILDAGCQRAREAAHETMQDVRAAVGLDY
ncbi:MAG TPA: tryptophan--tRNA ligase [Steroidobacteraceae bacterium]|nr:tryptophan--tRNA ligase [Steroidobacteraceae bacterium]